MADQTIFAVNPPFLSLHDTIHPIVRFLVRFAEQYGSKMPNEIAAIANHRFRRETAITNTGHEIDRLQPLFGFE